MTPPLYTITRTAGGQETNRAEHVALGQCWHEWAWLLWAMPIIEQDGFENLNYTLNAETISVLREK